MSGEFIPPDDPRWAEVLERAPHDPYHDPGYVAVAARHEGGEPLAFHQEADGHVFLIPLLVRELPQRLKASPGWRDAASAQGYGSPLVSPGASAATVSRFLRSFASTAHEKGIVSAFIRFHPLLPLPLGAFESWGALKWEGPIAYVDLSLNREELWAETRRDHCHAIYQLRRKGYEVVVDDWRLYPDFQKAYHETMDRVGATEAYRYFPAYFERLRCLPGGRTHLIAALTPSGRLASAGIFLSGGGIVQFHLSATAEAYRRAGASKIIIDHARQWAKERGFRFLHLGGGVGARRDSLFRFKSGFSNRTAEYITFRMVVDKERYNALAERARALDPLRDSPPDFFPIYR